MIFDKSVNSGCRMGSYLILLVDYYGPLVCLASFPSRSAIRVNKSLRHNEDTYKPEAFILLPGKSS